MTEGQEKVKVECDVAEVCGSGKGVGFDGWRSGFRQKLASACKEKLYSFADLAIFLRSSIDVVSGSVKIRRVNLRDGFLKIPFLRGGFQETFAKLFETFGLTGSKMERGLGGSDWQRNPRYRKTSLLENMARIIDENLGCEPGELCRMLFDCEERFYDEDEECCDGVHVDYRSFLKEIGFFKLLRDAVTIEYLDNEPTVVLALVSLFGSRALDAIGVVK